MVKKNKILDEISEADAYHILQRLITEDKEIKKRSEEIAKEHFSQVDSGDVAEDLFCELDSIDVHDLWQESGSTYDGYVDVNEHAWEMFEDVLDPFVDEMKKYQRLNMDSEAKYFCIGILKGLYNYEKHSTNEFADWAEDAPKDFSERVYEEWKRKHSVKKNIVELDQFIKKELTDW